MNSLWALLVSYSSIAAVFYWAGWSHARSNVEDELHVAKLLARADQVRRDR